MKTGLYPLTFTPILKEKVWGGTKLADLFGKEGEGNIGESWEVSGVDGNVSVVSNGELKGSTLTEVIHEYGPDLVGKKVFEDFGNTFPLLFKFIDAREDLSVQLHPDDELASERHDSFGKTEMWYIMHAEHDARLILGFNQDMDESVYLKHLSENKLPEILHSEAIAQGDSFFIAPGTVHAIGAGTLLAEIQQTSDITYRIYDWDRPDANGQMRELHTDLALAAIDYETSEARLTYADVPNTRVNLCSKPYFETNKWVLSENTKRDLSMLDSFVVYMCVDGMLALKISEEEIVLKKGQTALLPAVFDRVEFIATEATILEVYVP